MRGSHPSTTLFGSCSRSSAKATIWRIWRSGYGCALQWVKWRKLERMSTKKTESNRRNAQRSTGPHDTSVTRLNAVKHGLMAANPTAFDGELYEPMLQHFRMEFQPQSEIEDLLVQRIALY